MGFLANEIEGAAMAIGVRVLRLEYNTAVNRRQELATKFAKLGDQYEALSWQNLPNATSVHNPDAWRWLGYYFKDERVFLFLSYLEEGATMWQFQSGWDLVAVLSETVNFPFCVTSDSSDCIVCFDDHDCLLAKGAAASWLEDMRSSS